MTGTNCDLFTHKSSWSYLNHLVLYSLVGVSFLCINIVKRNGNFSLNSSNKVFYVTFFYIENTGR
jgi:hypothetical protein